MDDATKDSAIDEAASEEATEEAMEEVIEEATEEVTEVATEAADALEGADIPALDGADFGIVAITWALVWVIKKVTKDKFDKIRSFLPLVAVAVAIGTTAAMEASTGTEFSMATVMTGLVAAGVAVLGHSQGRELLKMLAGGGEDEEEDSSTEETEPEADPETEPEEESEGSNGTTE